MHIYLWIRVLVEITVCKILRIPIKKVFFSFFKREANPKIPNAKMWGIAGERILIDTSRWSPLEIYEKKGLFTVCKLISTVLVAVTAVYIVTGVSPKDILLHRTFIKSVVDFLATANPTGISLLSRISVGFMLLGVFVAPLFVLYDLLRLLGTVFNMVFRYNQKQIDTDEDSDEYEISVDIYVVYALLLVLFCILISIFIPK